MNWGSGIVLTLVGFIAVMATMVVICVKQDDIHLVTQDYYEQEIKYQEQIDRMINANAIASDALEYDGQLKSLLLKLPEGSKGTLHLFRPSDARLDQKISFDMISSAVNSVDVKSLKAGYWRVKLTWSEGEKEYYLEKKINI
ncbi:MAG: nitrogen fixation protein FixH [Mongoliibacter sp.]|uniref:FixH family protein n=1 Tax=Mongoliibacter sp. TaxID=2022438 RepID=UPI0012F2ED70|nr:FixH family protein [Mongoliibacter sp.]TVP51002.1 MAG: nitrogen fixation protein FixH [Mongoliibacter sp.]